MKIKHTKLSKEIAIEDNLFMHNNKLYERMYGNHAKIYGKYRFFINQNNYDYTNTLIYTKTRI